MSARIDAVPTATGRDWPTVAALAALSLAFAVVAGPRGLVAGLATAVVGAVLGPVYALAIGHVALVAVVPEGIDPRALVLVEAGFVAVLLAPLRRAASPGRIALLAAGGSIALAGLAWLVADAQSTVLAAVTVFACLALAVYGLHRYELVRLGLVPDDDGDESPPDGPATAEPSTDRPAASTAGTTTDTPTET